MKIEDGKCDDKVSMNSCKLTLSLKKIGGKLEEELDDDTTFTYTKADKKSLKLLD